MTDKEDVVPTYNGVLHSHNKNEILSFVTRRMMDLEGIILSEISQVDKHKYHMITLICEIWK